MSSVEGSQDWVAAGLDALAEGGIDGVRVEVVAQRLGVTKGGFYRRYRDRRALLEAMLAAWVEGRIAAIRRQSEEGGEAPADRLRGFIRLFSARQNVQGLAIELAMRQWARSDAAAAAAVARVDEARLAIVSGLYEQLGFPRAEAQARGVIIYSFLFGEGLLFLDLDTAAREAMMEACAEALVSEP
ncbi:MAG: TetR/AcrR family transcriptional regulator [Phenylobacterium sp.]